MTEIMLENQDLDAPVTIIVKMETEKAVDVELKKENRRR